jgi:PadR family transcriptional regulator PadR
MPRILAKNLDDKVLSSELGNGNRLWAYRRAARGLGSLIDEQMVLAASAIEWEKDEMKHSPCALRGKVGDSPKSVMGEGMEKQGELVQGTLDMLVLKALARGAKHGYGVAEWIHESSNDVLHVEEGALYPALHRLELRGLLTAEWGASENNRRAKFYSLTGTGKKKLAEEAEYWRRMSGAIAQVMQTA